MEREELISKISKKLKLIRVDSNYSQEEMSVVLGVSKKTLIQIEKGRLEASWTIVVATISLFQGSDIITNILGDDPLEVVELIAHKKIYTPKEKTLGGKVWWLDMQKKGDYRLQQNILSKHFRILDNNDYRWYSTFEKDDANNFLMKISKEPINE